MVYFYVSFGIYFEGACVTSQNPCTVHAIIAEKPGYANKAEALKKQVCGCNKNVRHRFRRVDFKCRGGRACGANFKPQQFANLYANCSNNTT